MIVYYIKEKEAEPKEIITITDYYDMGNDYRPKVDFNLTYDNEGFHAHFDVYEKNPKAVYTKHFEPTHKDSCVEWFIFFAPDMCNRYFNFEVNANGVVNVSFRVDRYDKIDLTEEDAESFGIVTEIKEDYWTVDYTIPFDFIKKYIKGYEFKRDVILKSNVYKCGDETEFEHYGCWGMGAKDEPDFHTPQYFKEMKVI